jgi:hypothetical protein
VQIYIKIRNIKKKMLDSARKDAGCWMLDAGCWMCEGRMLDAGYMSGEGMFLADSADIRRTA